MMDNNWHGRRWEIFSAKRSMRPVSHGHDTRRRNAAGKLIGGHDSRFTDVPYYRKGWARAERRYAKAQLRGIDRMRGLVGYRREYNWKGT